MKKVEGCPRHKSMQELAECGRCGEILLNFKGDNSHIDKYLDRIYNLKLAFEYLVSTLPEECTAGFVTHARAIASGDSTEIERTK